MDMEGTPRPGSLTGLFGRLKMVRVGLREFLVADSPHQGAVLVTGL